MREITGRTVLTGLLGSPVAHSMSPLMHNEAFELLGLDYVYMAFDVGTEHLETAVQGFKAMGVRGFNLTMPDKNDMCLYVDTLSPAAKLCGAVNTVVNDNGHLTGYTTDGIGFMHALADEGFLAAGKKMTLLGGGGAATAVAVQAALDGMACINIFNRPGKNFEKLEKLAEKLNTETDCHVQIEDIGDTEKLKAAILDSQLLTNGTNVGMAPDTEGCLITDTSMLHPDLFVADLIYNPRETKLIKLAKAAGCRNMNGLYMLLYQGAEAFRLWTGQEMPVAAVKDKYFSDTQGGR